MPPPGTIFNDGSQAAAPSVAQATYQTGAEVLAILASVLPSTDARRTAFEAASGGDRDLFAARATADIDAVRWKGEVESSDQRLLWPRVEPWMTRAAGGWSEHANLYIDPDPDSDGTESVANLPKALKVAHAIQTAHHAARARGLDPTHRLEEAGRRGVTGHSGSGRSETIDPRVANSPWARLAIEAQQGMGQYRAVSAMSR